MTAALNAFTLGVAGVALLTSLLTLANSAAAATGAAVGDRHHRRRLAAIELLKTMSVALITTIFALPLGLLVAWCLLAVVNVKAFGWRLPFHVFPLQLLWLHRRGDGGRCRRVRAPGHQAGAHAAGRA